MEIEQAPTTQGGHTGRTTTIGVILVVILIGVIAGSFWWSAQHSLSRSPARPSPCAQVSEPPTPYSFVECQDLKVTQRGTSCSLTTGVCAMILINNGTSHNLEVLTTACSVGLPSTINGTGNYRTVYYTVVEGINGGPAATGVKPGAQSSATCMFPTNRYMDNITIDQQSVNGCFTVSQAGNQTNSVQLCWGFGKWSAAPVTIVPLDCQSLLGRVTVSFHSLNSTSPVQANITNANSYGIWVTCINNASTVDPDGFAVTDPYYGDAFAIPEAYTILAGVTSPISLLGTAGTDQYGTYALSFLPTNETITYTPSCEITYEGVVTTSAH